MSSQRCRFYLKRADFTLVECIVVAAVLAILISLLSPSFQKTIENGRRLNCQNNLRQVGVGNHAHVDDFGDLAPGKIQRGIGANGVYSVWTASSKKHPQYDGFESHGILGYLGYVDPISFYCPSWVDHDKSNWFFAYDGYGIIGDKKVGGGPAQYPEGEWSPRDLNYRWLQTQYHYRQGIPEGRSVRGPSILKDSPVEPMMADAFSSPSRGVREHHQDGYNVLYIDGAVTFNYDSEYLVENMNEGKSFHSGRFGYRIQERVYKNNFAR